jgi:hypothetical protein
MSKTMKNHLGEDVPIKYIPKSELKKEALTQKALKEARKISDALVMFKGKMLESCDLLYAEIREDENISAKKSKKGNYTLFSFDKSIKIEVAVQDRIEFDDNINLAQEKLKEFLVVKTKGADADLSALVNQAFQTTKGRLDTKRIFGLFSLQINHPLWSEAMELIKKSINRNVSKRYMTVWEKNEEGEYKQVQLNFASI